MTMVQCPQCKSPEYLDGLYRNPISGDLMCSACWTRRKQTKKDSEDNGDDGDSED